MHAEPELTLDGDRMKVVEETEFLGLIFDKAQKKMPESARYSEGVIQF